MFWKKELTVQDKHAKLLKKCTDYETHLHNDLSLLFNMEAYLPKNIRNLFSGEFNYANFMSNSGIASTGIFFKGYAFDKQNNPLLQGCTKMRATKQMISILTDYPVYNKKDMAPVMKDQTVVSFTHKAIPLPPIPFFVYDPDSKKIIGPVNTVANLFDEAASFKPVDWPGKTIPTRITQNGVVNSLKLPVPNETEDSKQARITSLESFMKTDDVKKLSVYRNKSTPEDSRWQKFIFIIKWALGMKPTTGEALVDEINNTISPKLK